MIWDLYLLGKRGLKPRSSVHQLSTFTTEPLTKTGILLPFWFVNLTPKKPSLPLLTKDNIDLQCIFGTEKKIFFLTLKNKFPAIVRASTRKQFSLSLKGRKLSQRTNPVLGLGNFRLLSYSERTWLLGKSLLILGNLLCFCELLWFLPLAECALREDIN